MDTPNRDAIVGLLRQADAGLWRETDEVPEGGLLTGLIAAVNRGSAPTPVACRLAELEALRDAGLIMAGDAPHTYLLNGASEGA